MLAFSEYLEGPYAFLKLLPVFKDSGGLGYLDLIPETKSHSIVFKHVYSVDCK